MFRTFFQLKLWQNAFTKTDTWHNAGSTIFSYIAVRVLLGPSGRLFNHLLGESIFAEPVNVIYLTDKLCFWLCEASPVRGTSTLQKFLFVCIINCDNTANQTELKLSAEGSVSAGRWDIIIQLWQYLTWTCFIHLLFLSFHSSFWTKVALKLGTWDVSLWWVHDVLTFNSVHLVTAS